MSMIQELEHIADLRYRRELARLAPLLAEEARLRGELARLGEMERSARGSDAIGLMRPFGADLLWSAWIEKRRRDLNLRLARVLARREADMAAMRLAHGRLQALRMIAEQDVAAARHRWSALDQAALHSLMMRRP